jgi:hypothetical protein
MKTVKQFLEPIVIRWIMRNKCYYCAAPAVRKCRTHGTRICESSHCKMTHRRLKASVSGDLTRPFCEYFPLVSWKQHLLRTGVALAVGLLVTAIVAL